MFMRALLFAVFALTLLSVVSYAGPTLVVNGGFENGDFTGWTQFGNTGFTSVVCGGGAAEGSCFASFGQVGSIGGIFQNLATTSGALYDISFWLENTGGPTNSFGFTWDGGYLQTYSDAGSFGWTHYTFLNQPATTASTGLVFAFRQDPSFWHLDGVSVSSSIPEPSTVLLLAAGLLALGARAAKRRLS
jgi:hypothetical protein